MALSCSALAGYAVSAQKPKIPKPIPAQPRPMPPLPPAVLDDNLAIGGEDIDARMKNTRMTVEVKVNGRGPYRFLSTAAPNHRWSACASPATCNCR